MTDYNALREKWEELENFDFESWDFSQISGKIKEEPLPWDYKEIIQEHLTKDMKLLDMGTGGGEFLLTLNHPYENIYATEGYEPNYELCMEKLAPLGINVTRIIGDESLPFEDSFFDIIINRQESFDSREVWRALKPGGLFITQQVGGLNNKALSEFLIEDFEEIVSSEFTLHSISDELQAQSFKLIFKNEYFPYLRFYDMGALIQYAKVIEWEFPDFSVDNCFTQLCRLHDALEQKGYIESKEHRFIIAVRK